MSLWMLQTKTSHLWKVSYAIILLGWRYFDVHGLWLFCELLSEAFCHQKGDPEFFNPVFLWFSQEYFMCKIAKLEKKILYRKSQ